MFSHYATRKISPICKISAFSEDLSFLNPRSHLNNYSGFFWVFFAIWRLKDEEYIAQCYIYINFYRQNDFIHHKATVKTRDGKSISITHFNSHICDIHASRRFLILFAFRIFVIIYNAVVQLHHYLSVFDHFVGLALKGLTNNT